jgi:hypothetical protein
MKPGLVLGVVAAVWAATGVVPAQNLGLGTGSRAYPSEDSTTLESRTEETAAPRKTQINRRLGLTARKGKDFDPKVFEARGRDLQNQFYEIGIPANPKQFGESQPAQGASVGDRKNGSRQWLFWVGVAGLTGTSAGVVGYLLMNKAHPASTPPEKPLVLTDEP